MNFNYLISHITCGVFGVPLSIKRVYKVDHFLSQPLTTISNPYQSKTYLDKATRALIKFVVGWGDARLPLWYDFSVLV